MLTLIIRHPIPARLVQIALFLATVEWISITNKLMAYRMYMGSDYMRMTVILGVVALVAFLSIFVFSSKTLKNRYGLSEKICL